MHRVTRDKQGPKCGVTGTCTGVSKRAAIRAGVVTTAHVPMEPPTIPWWPGGTQECPPACGGAAPSLSPSLSPHATEELLCAPGMGEYLPVPCATRCGAVVTVSPPTLSLLPQGGLLDNAELNVRSRAWRRSSAGARRTRWVGASTLGCSQCPPLSLCPLGAP